MFINDVFLIIFRTLFDAAFSPQALELDLVLLKYMSIKIDTLNNTKRGFVTALLCNQTIVYK